MQSKTSLFNKELFLSDLKRFWPLAVITFLFEAMALPLNIIIGIQNQSYYYMGGSRDFYLADCLNGAMSTRGMFLFAGLAMILVFQYLQVGTQCNMLHAFPVSRTELFITHFVGGEVLVILPSLLNYLIVLVIAMVYGLSGKSYILLGFFVYLVYAVLFGSIGALSSMVAGTLFGSIALYGILNFAVAVFQGMMEQISHFSKFGYNGWYGVDYAKPCTPVLYLAEKVGIHFEYDEVTYEVISAKPQGLVILGVYFLVGVAVLALSLFVYKKRALEKAGEFLTISLIKPIFKLAVSVMASVWAGIIMVSVFDVGSLSFNARYIRLAVFTLILGAIIYYAVEMIVAKSFRVFKKTSVILSGVFMILLAGILVVMKMDFPGYESYVPSEDEVVMAGIESITTGTYVTEEVSDIRALHEYIIRNKEEMKRQDRIYYGEKEYERTYDHLTFVYQLKDGTTVNRSYDIFGIEKGSAGDLVMDETSAFFNNPSIIRESLFTTDYDILTPYRGEIVRYHWNGEQQYGESEYENIKLDSEGFTELYQAYLKDVEEGNIDYYFGRSLPKNYFNSLELSFVAPKPIIGMGDKLYGMLEREYIAEGSGQYMTSFVFGPKAYNTIDALIRLGIIASKEELITNEDTVW